MLGWFKRLFGTKPVEKDKPLDRPRVPAGRPRLHSRYDAAETNQDNSRHWARADNLSPREENSLAVRQVLRRRSRYEVQNNGYAGGMIQRLADDTVGTGPRLQVLLEDPEHNAWLEAAWNLWAEGEGADPTRSAGLAGKLHLMAQARPRCGEAFGVLTTNDELISPVKLDMLVIETDQVTTPSSIEPGAVDGVELDGQGKPAYWHILREHPGDNSWFTSNAYDRVPVSRVLHWFRPTRPGQIRGAPEITASLPLYAQMRRWTDATLTAAETAADFAAVVTQDKDKPVDPNVPPVVAQPFDTVEIEKGLMPVLAPGDDISQIKAEHPTTEYGPFKRELLKQTGSPVNAPLNVAGNDSSDYNYSSAQMDTGRYYGGIDVVRGGCNKMVVDRLFWAFLEELRLIPDYCPFELPDVVPHVWHYPARRAIDPLKEAAADTERLANGTTNLATIYAAKGQDWEEQIRQLAKEVALCKELGINHPAAKEVPAPTPVMAPPDEDEDEQDDEEDMDERPAARRPGRRNRHARLMDLLLSQPEEPRPNGRAHP